MARVRNFCFTVNNYNDFDVERLSTFFKEEKARYLVFGKEVGEQGTPHLQGYCELETQLRFNNLKNKFVPGAHIEKRRGTAAQAANYCKKDGDYEEMGKISNPGKRTDLHKFVDDVKENPDINTRDIIEKHTAIMAKYPKFVDVVRSTYQELKDLTVFDNLWIWGPPGVGKSKKIRDDYGDSLFSKGANKWFCGYEDEKTVLIDDLDPDSCKYLVRYIKIWSDRYVFPAEVKNGGRKIRPERICITSNYSLEECFPNPQDLAALKRRFKVIHMAKPFGG